MAQAAHDVGDSHATNMAALGDILALTGLCRAESLKQATRGRCPKGFLQFNVDAMARGWRPGRELVDEAGGARRRRSPVGGRRGDAAWRGAGIETFRSCPAKGAGTENSPCSSGSGGSPAESGGWHMAAEPALPCPSCRIGGRCLTGVPSDCSGKAAALAAGLPPRLFKRLRRTLPHRSEQMPIIDFVTDPARGDWQHRGTLDRHPQGQYRVRGMRWNSCPCRVATSGARSRRRLN